MSGTEFILHSGWGFLLLLPAGSYANRCLLSRSHSSEQHTLIDARVHIRIHLASFVSAHKHMHGETFGDTGLVLQLQFGT